MELGTTSHAILSLLAVRPWTTYELARQMERSVNTIWPRASSVVYEEPKRLVGMGLAASSHSYTGRRRSTTYEITPAGRQALAQWLQAPGGAGPALEHEALLKVAFADHGSVEQLRATVDAILADAQAREAILAQQIREYREHGGPFPERLPVISLISKLVMEQSRLLVRWAQWCQAEVADWPGVTPDQGADVAERAFTTGWPSRPRAHR